jgi:hypothetical protein
VPVLDFHLCPKRAAKGRPGDSKGGEKLTGAHLSRCGAQDCFWCQTVFQLLLSALPEPAEVRHRFQGGAGTTGVQWGGEGMGMEGCLTS